MNNKRKLVTIRKISNLLEIPGCSEIILAVIDGWQVIVKKSEFQVGDDCLFFEIDSFIPATDERFAFLKKTTTFEGKEGYRLKTMKMKGVISQGLALPLHMFPELPDMKYISTPSCDLSEKLGVIKYDVAVQDFSQRPSLKAGKPRGSFPSFIPKTDQERIQNLTSYFETMKDEEFEETLKLDGSSMTCYKIKKEPSFWDKVKSWFGLKTPSYHFGVCSRNLELKRTASESQTFNNNGKESVYDQSNFWTMAIKADIENKLPEGYAVQGELIGPKIQANHEKVSTLEYYVFDVFDINSGTYLLPFERREFCEKYSIPHVPVVSKSIKIFEKMDLAELLQHVEGESMNPGTISEGRVYKHTSKPITFKTISNKYLLKSEQ